MKINFRQGIQRAPLVSGHPSFLTYNPGNNTIDIKSGIEALKAVQADLDEEVEVADEEATA